MSEKVSSNNAVPAETTGKYCSLSTPYIKPQIRELCCADNLIPRKVIHNDNNNDNICSDLIQVCYQGVSQNFWDDNVFHNWEVVHRIAGVGVSRLAKTAFAEISELIIEIEFYYAFTIVG